MNEIFEIKTDWKAEKEWQQSPPKQRLQNVQLKNKNRNIPIPQPDDQKPSASIWFEKNDSCKS